MKNNLLIKNAILVDANSTKKTDIFSNNGKIVSISSSITDYPSDTLIYDAEENYVFAGAIDPHVHLQLPIKDGFTADNFLTGSKAAIIGGTTTIIDFVTPQKNQSFFEALNLRKEEAKNSYTDYSLHVSPTWWGENSASQMQECIKSGVSSFKVYLAYKQTIGIDDSILIKVFETASKNNAIVTLHCENGDTIQHLQNMFITNGLTTARYHALSRPQETEVEAVFRAIELAKIYNTTIYIVHISTGAAVQLVKNAQLKGQKVMAETCPHYLVLNDEAYLMPENKAVGFIMSPPLRKRFDNEELWKNIQSGHIQTVGTDHCPFFLKTQKNNSSANFAAIPNGVGGIEHRLSLLYNFGVLQNKISMNKLVEVCAEKPAEIFGLHHCKGFIKNGFDADIVVWDSETEWTITNENIAHNCDYSIYEGLTLKGKPKTVFQKGKIVFNNNLFYPENCKSSFIEQKMSYLVEK